MNSTTNQSNVSSTQFSAKKTANATTFRTSVCAGIQTGGDDVPSIQTGGDDAPSMIGWPGAL